MSAKTFVERVRLYAASASVPDAAHLTSHAFRRGMARDIIAQGGSVAALMRAGGWQSKAFLKYLRDSHIEDQAVSQMLVDVSESEDEI